MTTERWWEIMDIADQTIPGGPLLPVLRECLREIDRAQRAEARLQRRYDKIVPPTRAGA